MIAFTCPACKSAVQRHDQEVGTKVSCPSCGQRLQVPKPSQDSPTLMGVPLPEPLAAPKTASDHPAKIIRCVCPQCQAVIKAPAKAAGARSSCPRCGAPMEIPTPRAELVEDVLPVSVTASPPMPVGPSPEVVRDYSHGHTALPRGQQAGTGNGLSGGMAALILGIVLLVGLGGGLLLTVILTSAATNDSEVVKLRNQISSSEVQLDALDAEFRAAVARGNAAHAAVLGDQIAAKYEDQAILCDMLTTRLAHGPERDSFVRIAADSRANAQRCRTQSAHIRSSR